MNGFPPQPSVWAAATNADGRVYYYNSQTKATQWTKPEELMTPAERALANVPWKEYTAEGGRKYWYNTESKETTWEMPEVLKNALAQSQRQPPSRPAAPQFVAGSASDYQDNRQDNRRPRDRDDYQTQDRPERQSGYGIATMPSNEPEYTKEDAEAHFFKLLKRVGAQPDWTWEQGMRATIKDPMYRAIKDPRERRSAFDKYIAQAIAQEKEQEKEKQAKRRADFTGMLRTHPEIKYYTRWASALPIIQKETLFRAAKDEDERRTLFDEYRSELYKRHVEQESVSRKAALDQLTELLNSLDLAPYTRWAEAQSVIQSNEQFQDDETFKALHKIDIVMAFEKHIKQLERSFNDRRQKEKSLKFRRERQNRDKYKQLLRELKAAGKIKAGTKWMTIYPLIEDDPRFLAILGQSGSHPLDLFWDMTEELERLLEPMKLDVLDTLEDKRFEITPKTTFEEFITVMETDPRTAAIEHDALNVIFERMREKVLRRNDKAKHEAERQQRRAVDALRSRIKHLEPPVAVGDSWEQVRSRVDKLEEYRVLDSDELRRSAFEKVMRRLEDKEREYEKEHGRRDRSRDKERDRGHRNGHSKRHRTRTPEVDAYEADRRKAMADRERNYGKKGVASFSPPPRTRVRDEADRYDGRTKRQVSSSYDRENSRRDREPRESERDRERDRSFASRADPRDRGTELDYGDSRPPSLRRRRESEESPRSMRDSKRLRRGDRLSREGSTPQAIAVAPPKEDIGFKSGSEEGEIEEE